MLRCHTLCNMVLCVNCELYYFSLNFLIYSYSVMKLNLMFVPFKIGYIPCCQIKTLLAVTFKLESSSSAFLLFKSCMELERKVFPLDWWLMRGYL
jgi:hypothetical protein